MERTVFTLGSRLSCSGFQVFCPLGGSLLFFQSKYFINRMWRLSLSLSLAGARVRLPASGQIRKFREFNKSEARQNRNMSEEHRSLHRGQGGTTYNQITTRSIFFEALRGRRRRCCLGGKEGGKGDEGRADRSG